MRRDTFFRGPHIWIRDPWPEAELFLPAVKYEGFVSWKLVRRGRVIRESGPQKNLIVNKGLDLLFTNNLGNSTAAACGTGSTAPAITDIDIVAQVGTAVNRASWVGAYTAIGGGVTEDFWEQTTTFTFLEANANGNLTEFGVWYDTFQSSSQFFARQLFKDSGGTPTTVVKTTSDQLIVTYTIRSFPPVSDSTQLGFAISGDATTTDITLRVEGANDSDRWGKMPLVVGLGGSGDHNARAVEDSALVARTSTKSGAVGFASSHTLSTYVGGDFFRDNTTIWQPATGNYASGIGFFELGNSDGGINHCLFQASLTTKVAKTNIKRCTIAFRYSIDRH